MFFLAVSLTPPRSRLEYSHKPLSMERHVETSQFIRFGSTRIFFFCTDFSFQFFLCSTLFSRGQKSSLCQNIGLLTSLDTRSQAEKTTRNHRTAKISFLRLVHKFWNVFFPLSIYCDWAARCSIKTAVVADLATQT